MAIITNGSTRKIKSPCKEQGNDCTLHSERRMRGWEAQLWLKALCEEFKKEFLKWFCWVLFHGHKCLSSFPLCFDFAFKYKGKSPSGSNKLTFTAHLCYEDTVWINLMMSKGYCDIITSIS